MNRIRNMSRGALLLLLGLLVGCEWTGGLTPKKHPSTVQARDAAAEAAALRDEIRQTYPEATATGRFEALADFERHGDIPGAEQAPAFACQPPMGQASTVAFSYDEAHTGTGGLSVTLDPGTRLVFTLPGSSNIAAYTLLSVALRSDELRDDLRITLHSDAGPWTSPRILTQPGWNDVQVDIQRLSGRQDFNTQQVQQISLEFPDAASPVHFAIDDILLIDNRRQIQPTPTGLTLRKAGLDFGLADEFAINEIPLIQSADGLWRMGLHQPTLRLAGPGEPLAESGQESLAPLGEHRVGKTTLDEHNPVRICLQNCWYFPMRAGQWASMGVRHVQWTYTVYADGRRVTDIQLNNAGGATIERVAIDVPSPAAWTGHDIAASLIENPFVGPIGHWSLLQTPDTPDGQLQQQNYLAPATIQVIMGQLGHSTNSASFDPGQGCYVLTAERGHCRFTFDPDRQPVLRPVFRVYGPFAGDLRINSRGLAIRDFQRLDDGSVLFVLPGRLESPTAVEVRGTPVENFGVPTDAAGR